MSEPALQSGVTEGESARAVSSAFVIKPPWKRHRTPYPGFRPFEIDEADIYFGREKQIDRLLERLESSRFIAVAGPSGCGKSSLVKAGVLSAIRAGFLAKAGIRWRVGQFRPGKQPFAPLAEALHADSALGPEYADPDALGLLHAMLQRGPLGLVQTVREAHLPPKTNVLVLVDQFEEIFRHPDASTRDEVEAFVELLVTASQDPEVPIYVIITMRSDFIGECSTYPSLSEAVSVGLFLTPRMTREECTTAIMSPARVFGGSVDPALANRLLNEMGSVSDQLPPLQHVLMRLWDVATASLPASEVPARKVRLTADHYKVVGTLESALSAHANEAFGELNEKDQVTAEVLFRSLVDVTVDNRRTRRSIKLSTVAARAHSDVASVERVVGAFLQEGRSFLVRSGAPAPSGEATVDITHESLIRLWDRLRGWSDDEARWLRVRRLLTDSANEWKDDKQGANYLYRGRRLRDAKELMPRYPGELGELEKQFIDASSNALLALVEAGFPPQSTLRIFGFSFTRLAASTAVNVMAKPMLGNRLRSIFDRSRTNSRIIDSLDDGYTYDACILYGPADAKTSQRIERFFETFHLGLLPAEFPLRRLRTVRLDLASLEDEKNARAAECISDSRYLVVLCSEATARSVALDRHVSSFLRRRSPQDLVLFVMEGATGHLAPGTFPPSTIVNGKEGLSLDLREYRDKRRSRASASSQLVIVAAILNGRLDTDRVYRWWQRSRAARYALQLLAIVVPLVILLAERKETEQLSNQVVHFQQQAIEANKASDLLVQAGTAVEQQNYDAAIALYQQALRVRANDARLQSNTEADAPILKSLGDAYMLKKDSAAAIFWYTRAIGLGLKSYDVYLHRANAYALGKEYGPSIFDYTQALEIDPNNKDALFLRALVKRDGGDAGGAADDLLRAVRNSEKRRLTGEAARFVLTDMEVAMGSDPANAKQLSRIRAALQELALMVPRIQIFVHYGSRDDLSLVTRLNDELGKTGFPVSGLDKEKSHLTWRVDYFHEADEPTARELVTNVQTIMAKLGAGVKLEARFHATSDKPPGVFALWIPELNPTEKVPVAPLLKVPNRSPKPVDLDGRF